MDYSSRPGQKTGTGALLSSQELAIARRDRLRKLALETIDLINDP
jgi:splicing factor 3A subunit 2